MNLILDTSVIIEIERGNREILEKLDGLRKQYPSAPKISFISYFEFYYGIKEKSIKNKEKSLAFIDMFEIINATKSTAQFLVLLKANHELSLSDLIIAAQVMQTNGILVTKDKDFDKISEIEKIIL